MTLIPKDLASKLPHILLGGGMGAGATLIYVLAEKEPKALLETVQRWGVVGFIGILAVVFVSQGASRVLDLGEKILPVLQENAASQQRLADAVHEIATRDDYRAAQQELLMGHVAVTMEKVMAHLQRLEENNQARGAGA